MSSMRECSVADSIIGHVLRPPVRRGESRRSLDGTSRTRESLLQGDFPRLNLPWKPVASDQTTTPAEPKQGTDGQFNLMSMPRYYEDLGSLISAGLPSKAAFADEA